jgi:flagellar biosynthesis/type III secretory pathway chaperone
MKAMIPEIGHEENKGFKVTASDMIKVITKLSDLLAKENELLDMKQITQVEELQEEKERLTRIMSFFKSEIQKDPSVLGRFPKVQMRELKCVVQIFDRLLNNNYQTLVKARAVNEKVVEAVASSLHDHVTSQSGYNKDGGMGNMGSHSSIPSIAFKQEI